MVRRKPSWLRLLCPSGVNPAHLVARKCGTCGEWVAVDTGGPVEEVYDPGVLDANDLVTAVILGRRFTRIQPIAGTGLIALRTPCGSYGVSRDGLYLAVHECFRTPLSMKPFKPPKQVEGSKWVGPRMTDEEIRQFETAWRSKP
ncbi:hypothetical protein JS533_005100 [Bifidobacterium amazonense]|uniref:Uncharacterized protein n=1 Tax=Bifidobacterium amazonense TaxID=2809027 RepID=A0ABS9VU81_9BIFI|nr:hypothetical protein [Bifidobacterium amazonense]MCH9275650.1 hypothetical protein [Bifidobacterium amazonense]